MVINDKNMVTPCLMSCGGSMKQLFFLATGTWHPSNKQPFGFTNPGLPSSCRHGGWQAKSWNIYKNLMELLWMWAAFVFQTNVFHTFWIYLGALCQPMNFDSQNSGAVFCSTKPWAAILDCLGWSLSQMLHDAGTFTYKTGFFHDVNVGQSSSTMVRIWL